MPTGPTPADDPTPTDQGLPAATWRPSAPGPPAEADRAAPGGAGGAGPGGEDRGAAGGEADVGAADGGAGWATGPGRQASSGLDAGAWGTGAPRQDAPGTAPGWVVGGAGGAGGRPGWTVGRAADGAGWTASSPADDPGRTTDDDADGRRGWTAAGTAEGAGPTTGDADGRPSWTAAGGRAGGWTADGGGGTGASSGSGGGPGRDPDWAPVSPGRVAAAVLGVWFTGRTWRELAYLLVSAVVSFAVFISLVVVLPVGAFLTVTLVGIPILAFTVAAARHLGGVHRALSRELLGERVEPPRPRRHRPGIIGGLRERFTDLAGWKAIAYEVVTVPFKVVGAWACVTTIGVAGILVAYPVLWQVSDSTQVDAQGVEHRSLAQFGDWYVDTWPRALLMSVLGIAVLLVVPWVVRLLVLLDRLAVRALLGPGNLSQRMADLEETRAHAVDDSAATLRRIERDLHDGTQARLVALAMQLDMARERLGPAAAPPDGAPEPGDRPDDDLTRARALLDTAHRNATEAITELREVTRSIHPPALDTGLDPALATLVARSGVPVTLRTDVTVRPSPAVETIAYFCAAELLTNVVKHSGARLAALDAFVVREAERLLLRLRVTDDGRGGATVTPGGGLGGLAERVRTIDGRMTTSSPPGGPTVVTVDLPLSAR